MQARTLLFTLRNNRSEDKTAFLADKSRCRLLVKLLYGCLRQRKGVAVKITEILKSGKLGISFEVFPPKTYSSFDTVRRATHEIAKLRPSFMSVTYGAGGGTSKYTLEIAKEIKELYGTPSLAHLTCVSSTREGIREKIAEIRAAGIENVMALRGDIPEGGTYLSDYKHAYELVLELRAANPDFSIGAACYPEIHPESKNQNDDIKYLREKVRCGCDFLTTQMFFDNNLLYNFLYKIREAGITVPVIPGIMPITNANQIERAIKLSGSFIPQRFKSLVDKFGTSSAAMKQAGIAYATDQIIDLYANGIRNVHVYSMNKPEVAERIMENLSDIIGNDSI